MDKLWSLSTTIRNPERIPDFFATIAQMNGEEWTKENQKKLQILLIKNRLYVPTPNGLTEEQVELLKNVAQNMTFEQAQQIFNDKNYKDPPMRGRTSFDPVEKMGLVHTVNNKVKVSELGIKFLNGDIDFGEVIFRSFLKLQYPNPLMDGFKNYNTKPFINTLRIIKKVNKLCRERGLKEKGISRDEFGIFVLSLKNYNDVDLVSNFILDYRHEKELIINSLERQNFIDEFTARYLSNYQDPVNNRDEYTDNMIRCLRLTRYIYIRGRGYYIDLEPRRMVEINSLLEYDDGSAKPFTKEEWINFMSDFDSYRLPWEELDTLTIIRNDILTEINMLSEELDVPFSVYEIPSNKETILEDIENLRNIRTTYQNLKLKQVYHEINKIDEVINGFSNIRESGNKPSVELERLSNIALNIINDSLMIKPNYPVGDDNEPTFTAPSKVPDIECYYETFNSICEVTMLTGRDQWFNEGQPVMRHLRDFEDSNNNKESYCIFIAPRIHQDTINTFWNSVKYEYQGRKQKIVPLTITQLVSILDTIRTMKMNNKTFSHEYLQNFLENCLQVNQLSSSIEWQSFINEKLENWQSTLLV